MTSEYFDDNGSRIPVCGPVLPEDEAEPTDSGARDAAEAIRRLLDGLTGGLPSAEQVGRRAIVLAFRLRAGPFAAGDWTQERLAEHLHVSPPAICKRLIKSRENGL
jgi:hypothetical protein